MLLHFRSYPEKNRDYSVGIATGYVLDTRGLIPGKSKFFSSPQSRPALGPTQPPVQWVPRAISPVVKRPWRQADHLHKKKLCCHFNRDRIFPVYKVLNM
jgi:hypothetical protein